MSQIPPTKPDWMSSEDYAFILERDQRRCVFYGRCQKSGGNAYCGAQLDLDHEQPESLGGDGSVANMRLLCASENRGRPVEPTPYWAEQNYFDGDFKIDKLRQIQRLAAWDEIDKLDIAAPRDLRRNLLGTTTLLPGVTGIGKTILLLSALHKINQIIGVGFPRVRHVLLCTNDTTLRDSAVSELNNDIVEHEIRVDPPLVRPAPGFDNLNRGPLKKDITVCAVESLWLADKRGAPRHTDLETQKLLLLYDTIVFDECDWGNLQVQRICRLANHTLQLSMTATPLIPVLFADGYAEERISLFMQRSVLISPTAVADYARARNLDGCLKILGDVQQRGEHSGHQRLEGGMRKLSDQNAGPDHAAFRSAILDAVSEADHLETQMKTEQPNSYYSPHVMVRMDSIRAAHSMYDDLREEFKRIRDLQNVGWDVTIVCSGHQRIVYSEPERANLSTKSNGRFVHPFMLALDNNGQALPDSKRVLLMCNIGIRGLNNWPVNFIVDCAVGEEFSNLAELVHFAYGRPIRWREKTRGYWLNTQDFPQLNDFATTRLIIPDTGDTKKKQEALTKAKDFVERMQKYIADAGFKTWEQILTGAVSIDEPIMLDGSNRALTTIEKYIIQGGLAQGLEQTGELSERWTLPMISTLFPDETNVRVRTKMKAYADRLVTSEGFRRREIGGDPSPVIKNDAMSVVEKLIPPAVHEIGDLLKFLKQNPNFNQQRDLYMQCFKDLPDSKAYKIAFDAVSRELRRIQTNNRGSAATNYKLHLNGGIFWELFGELQRDLDGAGQSFDKSKIYPSVIGAASALYDVKYADIGGPLDYPAYHIAILGRHRGAIIASARGRMIRNGFVGPMLQRLANVSDGKET